MSKIFRSSPKTVDTPSDEIFLYHNEIEKWRAQRRSIEVSTEPLLNSNEKRDSLYPIRWQGMWDFYKLHLASHWVSQEIDLSKDVNDWNSLNEDEKRYIKYGLAFFAGSDFIVNESQKKDSEEVQVMEYNFFNDDKISRENIHCVAPDTKVLTDKGYFPIQKLALGQAKIWNGYQFSDVNIQMTSFNSAIYRVVLSDGRSLDCTETHEWIILEGEKLQKEYTINLKGGERIFPYNFPFLSYPKDVFEYHKQSITQKLEGAELVLFEDGRILGTEIKYTSKKEAREFQETLEGFACDSIVYNKKGYSVLIYARALYKLILALEIVSKKYPKNKDFYFFQNISPARVVSIEYVYDSRTYCFNEPLNHTGVFNGICTGQSTTYADLLEAYVKDNKERETLKNAVKSIPTIQKKAEWMREYIEKGTFVERLIAEAIMEGIFFSGTFCAIFWMRKRGKLSALCDANEFIARDEGIHRDFNCYLYREVVKNKIPEPILEDMIRKAVLIEQEFVVESLPVKLLGMNEELMCKYIEYVADHLVYNLINKRIYKVENPFDDWMNAISLKVKADFFVHRPTAYSKTSILSSKEDAQIRFDDMDF